MTDADADTCMFLQAFPGGLNYTVGFQNGSVLSWDAVAASVKQGADYLLKVQVNGASAASNNSFQAMVSRVRTAGRSQTL